MTSKNENNHDNKRLSIKQQYWKAAVETTRTLTVIYGVARGNLRSYEGSDGDEPRRYTRENIHEYFDDYLCPCFTLEDEMDEHNWDIGEAIMVAYNKNNYTFPKHLAEEEKDYWIKEFDL